MAHERDERIDMQEEGEYHFSDDEQVNYEVEPEAAKTSVPDAKGKLVASLSQYRRLIIGLTVFFVLMFIVYKMIGTSSPTVPTEFVQGQTPPPVKMPAATQPAYQAPSIQPPQVSQPVVPVGVPTPVAPASTQAAQSTTTPLPGITQTITTPQPVAQISQPMQPASAPQQLSPGVPVVSQPTTAPASIPDRLTAVEQQNAQVMNTLQSDYAQKIADYDASMRALQGKVQNLTMRLASLEHTLNQLTQAIQGGKPVGPPQVISTPAVKSAESKITYTVQAIIPGRAWLKSDAGDTVTVAEGDVLKDLGKIIKIDPYDGIVEIDTGNKMISLSYGTSAD